MLIRHLRRLAITGIVALLAQPVVADTRLIETLQQGGLVILIRHTATEPGLGDPSNFTLDDCSTQRNLSEKGRDQARQLGTWFVSQGIPVGDVRTSQWCRCVDTAQLAFGDRHAITPWTPINSFFGDRSEEPRMTRAALASLSSPVTGNRVWITHQVNITALTGVFPSMGEMVVARAVEGADGYTLEPVGRLMPY